MAHQADEVPDEDTDQANEGQVIEGEEDDEDDVHTEEVSNSANVWLFMLNLLKQPCFRTSTSRLSVLYL